MQKHAADPLHGNVRRSSSPLDSGAHRFLLDGQNQGVGVSPNPTNSSPAVLFRFAANLYQASRIAVDLHRLFRTQRHKDTETQTDKETERQRDRDTEIQRYRETETEAHRHTDILTDMRTYTHTCINHT